MILLMLQWIQSTASGFRRQKNTLIPTMCYDEFSASLDAEGNRKKVIHHRFL